MLRIKRWTALLLAVIMLITSSPVDVLAETVSDLLDTRSFVNAMLARSGGYTVTFNYDDGVTPQVVISNVSYNTFRDDLMRDNGIPQTPTREGYEFRGWVPANVSYIQADTTYTAIWSTQNKYTLTVYYLFKEDNKVAAETVINTYAVDEGYSIKSPDVTGYVAETSEVSGTAGDDSWEGQTAKQVYVYYGPSGSTGYRIEYLLEELDPEDGYTVKDTLTGTATTGTYVEVKEEEAPVYEGFTLRPGQELRAKVVPEGSTVLQVYYTRNTYNLSFDSRGGTYEEPEGHRYGALISAPSDPTRTGYAFAGWYDESTDAPYTFSTMPSKDVSLYAVWTPLKASYTVVYWLQDANDLTKYNFESSRVVTGATVGSTVQETTAPVRRVTNAAGQSIPISRFAKSDSAVVQGDGSTVVNVYSDLIVFTYTFYLSSLNGRYNQMVFQGTTYRDNDKIYSLTARYGESLTGKWPSPVNATFTHGYYYNYRFTGWRPSFVNTLWVTQRWDITADMLPSNGTGVTLTAQWAQASQKTVSYMLERLPDESGGTLYNGKYYIKSSDYSQEYYSNSDSLSAKDIDGMQYVGSGGGNPDFVFYYDRIRSTLSFNTQGGPTPPEAVDGIMYGAKLSGYEPESYIGTTYEKDGVTYIFDGWYYQAEAQDQVDWPSATMPKGDLELFAKWKAPIHTVSFYRQAGDSVPYATIYVPHGQSVQQVLDTDPNQSLPAPVNPGYDFVTWRFAGASGAAFSLGGAVQQDTAVYAQWKLNNNISYRVEYVDADTLEPIAALPAVTRSGYYVGQTVSEQSPSLGGYLVDRPIKTLVLQPTNNLIQFKYKAKDPFGYDIIGRRSDTGEEIYNEHVNGEPNEYYVTVTAPSIPGYVPMAPAQLSRQLSYDAEQNHFIFYYLPSDLYAAYKTQY